MSRLSALRKGWAAKMKEVARDYKAAAEGTLEAMKARPIRATFYTGCAVFGFVAYKTAPTEAHYIQNLVDASNELLLCGSEKSKCADNHLQFVLERWAKGMLRHTCLGLFSVVHFTEHNSDTKSYKAVCKYSNPRWTDMPRHFVDFGFLGRWWRLRFVMTDFDVDFSEIPKEYRHFFDEYLDFFRTLFGYSYFKSLKAQERNVKLYVETIAGEIDANE